jgi:hypothetical protein
VAKQPYVPEPRYRPFRRAVYAIYIGAACLVAGLVIWSVLASVIKMSPRMAHAIATTSAVGLCTQAVQRLWDELEQQRRGLADYAGQPHAELKWTEFRVRWLSELRQEEAQCGVDAADRAGLKKAFLQLQHVGDLYTTSAVQFEGEIGPSVQSLRKALRGLEP